MKKYTKINLTITKFDIEDIITSSGEIVDASTFTGENATMYEIYKENSSADNKNVSVFTW
ncbi:MAG: hypothetical protein IJO88_06790 [Oscillospiraceae bacterium]|nr:hypothetical protein [Oscillospiraceae bacterium]